MEEDIESGLAQAGRSADDMESRGWHESARLVRETARDIRRLHEMFRP